MFQMPPAFGYVIVPLQEFEPHSHPHRDQSTGKMGRRLTYSQIQIICDVLSSGEKIPMITKTAFYSQQAVYYVKRSLEHFSTPRAPPAPYYPSHTQSTLQALCEHLFEKPTLYNT